MLTEDCYRPNTLDLLTSKGFVKICAPMVRYSKLAFRMLVRSYGCDVAFTPMIVCNSFITSQKARNTEFTTCPYDRPLVVQFAAKNGKEFADAAEFVCLNADGIDLNCGCPQRWALEEGYGATLMNEPELIKDMIHQVRNRIPNNNFTISIKTRLHKEIKETVEFCRRAENAGISWIAVHGRTSYQRAEPADIEGIKTIKESVRIPVIGNGDVYSLNDAVSLHERTGVNGVMSARGLLQNPALFTGTDCTTIRCLKDWINLSLLYGTSFNTFHRHISFMLEKLMSKGEKKLFHSLCSKSAVLDFLQDFM